MLKKWCLDLAMVGKAANKPLPGLMIPTPQKEEEEHNIWNEILSEISSKSGANVQGSVIMLGDDKCGKTTLLNRMCKTVRQSYASALEYGFLNIQSDLKDSSYAYQLGSAGAAAFGPSDSINLPVRMLGGATEFVPLLKFAMPQELNKCCFVLMAPIVPPEDILPSLKNWYKVVVDQINNYYSPEQIDAGKKAQIKYWKEYVEPLDTSMVQDEAIELDPHVIDLDPSILRENCGASIVVVLTKCDLYSELNDDQLNKIQFHVRKFCQERGAALVYTSAKDERNTQLLYKYLAHRVYGLPFTSSAYIVEKDLVFIPAGWETNQKLDILSEMLSDASLPTTIICEVKQQNKENVVIEDEQTFLSRLAILANEPLSSSPKRDQSMNKLNPQTINSSQVDGNSPIVSFFGNLMKGNRSNTSTPVVDPQAHFQKILNQKPKKSSISGLASGDQSPRGNLTAVSSASQISDQDMDDVQSDNSTINAELDCSLNSARDKSNDEEELIKEQK